MDMLLQIGLYLNVFVIGVLVAVATRHAYAHFRPAPQEKVKPRGPVVHIAPEVRDRLLQEAEDKFQDEVNQAAALLKHDLTATIVALSGRVDELGQAVMRDTMDRYRADIDLLRQKAEAALTGAQDQVDAHRAELTAKLDAQHEAFVKELQAQTAAERDRLTAQLDAKLGDAVMSLLDEAMQHNVDLGAQGPYLLKVLDEHKAELIEGVKS